MAAHAAGIAYTATSSRRSDDRPRRPGAGYGFRPRQRARARPRGHGQRVLASPTLDSGTSGSFDESLTATGVAMGTPFYMAPEQHRGGPVDHKADQYAFAVALWEALAGHRPFVGTWRALGKAKAAGPPRPPRTMPRRVGAALVRALAPAPAERFASMSDLAQAMDQRSARPRWIAAAAVGILGIRGLAWAASSDSGRSAVQRPDPEHRSLGSQRRRAALEGAFERSGLDDAAAAIPAAAPGQLDARVEGLVAAADETASTWSTTTFAGHDRRPCRLRRGPLGRARAGDRSVDRRRRQDPADAPVVLSRLSPPAAARRLAPRRRSPRWRPTPARRGSAAVPAWCSPGPTP